MRKRSIFTIALTLGLVASLGSASSVWAADARPLTAADLPAMGGTDFDGGPGDYLLRNDKIEAVILGITATLDFGIPIVAEALPGRGVIVDLGTRGDKNDQLTEIDHVANIAANVIFYGGDAEGLPDPVFVSGGATASITVSGIVLLPPIPPFPGSSFGFPTLVATTTYSVTDGKPWVDIEATVTNLHTVEAPVFSIADADILAGRSRIPFQPMEDRGHKPSLVDLNFGTLTVTNSTVSGNAADAASGIYDAAEPDSPLTLISNTLIEGDCGDTLLESNGYNIESPGDTCGFDQEGVTGVQLNLGPLQANGGPTETQELRENSVAIDQIPAAECVDGDGEPLRTDQRGETRPAGAGSEWDVGAFEVQP